MVRGSGSGREALHKCMYFAMDTFVDSADPNTPMLESFKGQEHGGSLSGHLVPPRLVLDAPVPPAM